MSKCTNDGPADRFTCNGGATSGNGNLAVASDTGAGAAAVDCDTVTPATSAARGFVDGTKRNSDATTCTTGSGPATAARTNARCSSVAGKAPPSSVTTAIELTAIAPTAMLRHGRVAPDAASCGGAVASGGTSVSSA